jgi:hypothetical protein
VACSRCTKKRVAAIRTLRVSDNFRSFSQEGIDDNVYFVQATSNAMIDIGNEVIRFLPGQLVKMTGTLLCSILAADSTMFRFRLQSDKIKFLSEHSSFNGVVL